MDTFIDHGLSEEERGQIDSVLLRYAHSATTHVDQVMTHHQSDRLLQQSMVDTRGSIFYEIHSDSSPHLHTTIKTYARNIPTTSRGGLDQLQLGTSNLAQNMTQQQVHPLPGKTPPPTAKLDEMYNLKEIDTVQKGVVPQSISEEPMIHNRVERPGAWDPTDIL